jgi:hypothetical protein
MPDMLVFDFTTRTVTAQHADGRVELIEERPLVVVGQPAPPHPRDGQ